jgi:hypothetical protein
MANYQCTTCGDIAVSDDFAPEACNSCGETSVINLDMQAKQIAAANDAFRAAIVCGGHAEYLGRVVCTQGVAAEGLEFVTLAQLAVVGFAAFTEDNDPYGDHSFGSVTVCDKVIWWKIDLYDEAFLYGAPDPLDAAQTRRLLTLLFPSEY